ncbi:MAG: SRPBCC family protein [Pseudomonadota bacterium]
MIRTAVTLAALVAAPALYGADLVSVAVERNGPRYIVTSVSTYDASQAGLLHVLLDYDNFHQVSSVFKEAKYLDPAPDGARRGYTRVEGCIVFFCQTIERIDRIVLHDGPTIVAISEPDPDDFKFSHASWRFEQNGNGVTIHYRLEMEPGFWVPPLVGPYMMKKKLVDGATDAMQRVEKRAQAFDNGTY